MTGVDDWASLEEGLLHDIFLRLELDTDAVHFRGVCRQWRAAAVAGTGTGTAFVPRPWLIMCAPNQHRRVPLRPSRSRREMRFRRVDGEMPFELEDSGSPAVVWRTSVSRGWAAVKHGEDCLLRDPIPGDEVPLPDCDPEYELIKVFLSDDPLAAASGEWMVFAFLSRHQHTWQWTYERRVAFCHAGDSEWTFLDAVSQRYRGIEFFRGQAYVLLESFKIAVCDVVSRRLVTTGVDRCPPWPYLVTLEASFLVSCGDDLLFVQVARQVESRTCWAFLAGRRRRRRRFTTRVYKVDFTPANGSGMPVGYTKVESIRDYALFVSPRSHPFALPARGFPGVKANRIYHVVRGRDEIVICRPWETRRLTPMPLEDVPEPRAEWFPSHWFCPRRPVLNTTTVSLDATAVVEDELMDS